MRINMGEKEVFMVFARRHWGWVTVLGLIVLALVIGHARSGDHVPWADYDPSVKARIDSASATRDCTTLQSEFDTADANNAATLRRTGHNNAALMNYIDDAMKSADCYG